MSSDDASEVDAYWSRHASHAIDAQDSYAWRQRHQMDHIQLSHSDDRCRYSSVPVARVVDNFTTTAVWHQLRHTAGCLSTPAMACTCHIYVHCVCSFRTIRDIHRPLKNWCIVRSVYSTILKPQIQRKINWNRKPISIRNLKKTVNRVREVRPVHEVPAVCGGKDFYMKHWIVPRPKLQLDTNSLYGSLSWSPTSNIHSITRQHHTPQSSITVCTRLHLLL